MTETPGESSAAARDALDAIDADRVRLAARVSAAGRWYYPLTGLATAALVASPATGSGLGVSFVAALATIALSCLEIAHRRQTGLTITRTAGPRSIAVIGTMGALVVALFAGSVALGANGHGSWIVATAVLGLAVGLVGTWLYDRVFGAELRRAR